MEPLGPKGNPILGVLSQMAMDPLGLFVEASRYGGVAHMRLGLLHAYLVNDPELIKIVLQDSRNNYSLGAVYKKLKPIFGNSLSMIEGDAWSDRRKLIQPAFNHNRLQGLAALIVKEIEKSSEKWKEDETTGRGIDIVHEMTGITARVIVKAMFGSDIELELMNKIADAIYALNEDLHKRLYRFYSLPLIVPTTRNRRFRWAISVLNEQVERVLNRSGDTVEGDGSLLSILLEKGATGKGGMTREQIHDEIITILVAGHETTANALSWFWYLMGNNPKEKLSLYEEVDAVLGRRKARMEDFSKLIFTRMMVEETLRLYPPAWNFLRTSNRENKLGAYRIRKGGLVFLCPYTVHRDPRYWDRPDVFDPERFSAGRKETITPFSYFPFGGGPRICIGQGFAMMEMVLIISSMVQRFWIGLKNQSPVPPHALVTLKPKGQMQIVLEPRW